MNSYAHEILPFIQPSLTAPSREKEDEAVSLQDQAEPAMSNAVTTNKDLESLHPEGEPEAATVVQSEPLKCLESEKPKKDSPIPVAPPRKKRQQKKDALSKDPSAPPKPPPPRPKNPPNVVKESEAKVEPHVEEKSLEGTLANQPCITVNSDTSDMDKVLLKGSSNEIVRNEDLDECKSPTGSKLRVCKDIDGRQCFCLSCKLLDGVITSIF